MGQYFKIVNLDRKEYLSPVAFDDDDKMPYLARRGEGVMLALAILLQDNYLVETPVFGTWARDRIVITGDYATPNLYDEMKPPSYTDISRAVLDAIRGAGLHIRRDEELLKELEDEALEELESLP